MSGKCHHVTWAPSKAWLVARLLVSVSLQATSGLFKSDDFLIEGPWHHAAPAWLNSLAARVHATNFNVLLGLVALHVTVMAIYRWRFRKNLVGAMVTGRQR